MHGAQYHQDMAALFLISAAFAPFGLVLEPLGPMVAIGASVILSAFAG